MDGRHIKAPFAGEPVQGRHARDRQRRDQRRYTGDRHEPQQPAELIQVLCAGAIQHGARVQEQQGLESPVVDGVEQRGEEGQRSQGTGGVAGRQQQQTDADAQENVTDLTDAVESQEPFGLFLAQGLVGAQQQGDGAENGDHQAPLRHGIVVLRLRRHQPDEIAHQTVNPGLDHHAR